MTGRFFHEAGSSCCVSVSTNSGDGAFSALAGMKRHQHQRKKIGMNTTTKWVPIKESDIRTATAELADWRRRAAFILPLSPAERHEHRAARLGPKALRLVDNRLV